MPSVLELKITTIGSNTSDNSKILAKLDNNPFLAPVD